MATFKITETITRTVEVPEYFHDHIFFAKCIDEEHILWANERGIYITKGLGTTKPEDCIPMTKGEFENHFNTIHQHLKEYANN